MKQILYILLFIIYGLAKTKGQSVSISEINSNGNYTKSQTYSVSYSVGGLAYNTLKNNNYLTQGFQQPYKIIISKPEYFQPSYSLKAQVYPNPAIDYINISLLTDTVFEQCYLRLLNENGKSVDLPFKTYEFSKGQNITMDLSNLRNGSYFLEIYSLRDNKRLILFKILKI